MSIHADKTKQQTNRFIGSGRSQKQGTDSAFQLADNRPASAIQRKLQRIADGSPQVRQLEAVQNAADNGVRVTQLRNGEFDAGIGAGWHIHYGEHVKYANNNGTRVNFGGRTRQQIGFDWEQKIQSNNLANTKDDADFIACKTWIRENIA